MGKKKTSIWEMIMLWSGVCAMIAGFMAWGWRPGLFCANAITVFMCAVPWLKEKP